MNPRKFDCMDFWDHRRPNGFHVHVQLFTPISFGAGSGGGGTTGCFQWTGPRMF